MLNLCFDFIALAGMFTRILYETLRVALSPVYAYGERFESPVDESW